jgi:hypothetical protein
VKSVITRLAPKTNRNDLEFGRIRYDVEIKGERPFSLHVTKVQRMSDRDRETVEIKVPAIGGQLAVALPTLDQIARNILPGARIVQRSKTGSARLMIYAAS